MPPQAFGIPLLQPPNPLGEWLKSGLHPGPYIFANAFSWVLAKKHPEMRLALEKAQGVFADGIGTSLACKIHSGCKTQRIPGPDFTHLALQEWKNKPMAFVGGSPKGFKILENKYQLRNATQILPPHRNPCPTHTLQDLKPLLPSPPEVLWVCLGSPKQELWAQTSRDYLPNTKIFSIGAAFSFLCEEKKRAPKLLQKYGLEWAHRLQQEPKRLLKRYLLGNPLLLFYCLLYKIQHPKP